METKNMTTENTNISKGDTKVTTENTNIKYSWGAFAAVAAGLAYMFMLAMGSWTDNRFGTHLVLSSDLSTAGAQEWFLVFVAVVGTMVSVFGIVVFLLNLFDVIDLNESQDNTLKVGSILLIGTAAFTLALSSISFAAFNWQYFESEMSHGTSNQAYAWISIVIISTVVVMGLTVASYTNLIKMDWKLYVVLRNSTMALVALGWLVFNLCINSFGAMGGDANVLVAGLTGNDHLLTDVGTFLVANQDATGLEIFQHVTGKDKPGIADVIWKNFIAIWDGTDSMTAWGVLNGIHAGLGDAIKNAGGLGQILTSDLAPTLVALGAGKEGMIMGVNNAFNSYLIFALLLLTGLIGIPTYGVLTYGKEDKTSVVFWGSIVTIVAISILYFFLILTPYMVNSKGYESSILGGLLLGDYGPSIAPGLIALPNNAGGIHSAIVYFSADYNGTTIWWLSEVLTFIIPVGAFVGSWLSIRAISNKEQ